MARETNLNAINSISMAFGFFFTFVRLSSRVACSRVCLGFKVERSGSSERKWIESFTRDD